MESTANTILIVESDPALRLLLQGGLAVGGYDTLTAAGAFFALEYAQIFAPVALVIDVTDIDDALAFMRDLSARHVVIDPIIGLLGAGLSAERLSGLKELHALGVSVFLLIPLVLQELLTTLACLIRSPPAQISNRDLPDTDALPAVRPVAPETEVWQP